MNTVAVDSLPPLPYLAHEILLAVNSADSDMAAIGATPDKEPGLRVRIVAASLLLSAQFDPARCTAFRAERYWHDAVAMGEPNPRGPTLP